MTDFSISFFIGALIPHGRVLWGRLLSWEPSVRPAFTLVAICTFLLCRRFLGPSEFAPSLAIVVDSIAAGFTVMMLYFSSPGLLSTRPLRYLGEVSYGIYLLHIPVLLCVSYFMFHYLGVGEWHVGFPFLAAITLGLCIPLATLTYYTIDRPFQKLGRQLAQRAVVNGRSALPINKQRLDG